MAGTIRRPECSGQPDLIRRSESGGGQLTRCQSAPLVSPAGIGWGVAAARAPTLLTQRGSALESGSFPERSARDRYGHKASHSSTVASSASVKVKSYLSLTSSCCVA